MLPFRSNIQPVVRRRRKKRVKSDQDIPKPSEDISDSPVEVNVPPVVIVRPIPNEPVTEDFNNVFDHILVEPCEASQCNTDGSRQNHRFSGGSVSDHTYVSGVINYESKREDSEYKCLFNILSKNGLYINEITFVGYTDGIAIIKIRDPESDEDIDYIVLDKKSKHSNSVSYSIDNELNKKSCDFLEIQVNPGSSITKIDQIEISYKNRF